MVIVHIFEEKAGVGIRRGPVAPRLFLCGEASVPGQSYSTNIRSHEVLAYTWNDPSLTRCPTCAKLLPLATLAGLNI